MTPAVLASCSPSPERQVTLAERLPSPVAARLRAAVPLATELAVLPAGTQVVRMHSLGGSYPSKWDAMRDWGPTKSRFDHHTTPQRVQGRAIAYLAWGSDAFTTTLAEYFQDDSGAGVPFDLVTSRPTITEFELATKVTLLDLSGPWITRAGGNQAICNGPRWRSRLWARAVYAAFGKPGRTHLVEGLAYRSSVWGPGYCAALWQMARSAFPPAPRATRLLDDPGLQPALAKAAEELGSYIASPTP